MKYIIFGSEGFLGNALVHLLSGTSGTEVVRVDTVPLPDKAYYQINISETDKLIAFCDREQPDVIINLAGSFKAATREEMFEVNCFSPLRFLEKSAGKKQRLILIGSAAEYGINTGRNKIVESTPLLPVSDYGISKACQTFLAMSAFTRSCFPELIITRPFNIIGPGVSERLFLGAFAAQIARIEKGLRPPVIKVGNIETYRDLLTVSGVAQGIKLIAEKGKAGEIYNLCSGKPQKISTVLEKLLSFAKLAIKIEPDPILFKTNDTAYSVGDNQKIIALGMSTVSEKEIEESLRDTLDWYRMRVKQ